MKSPTETNNTAGSDCHERFVLQFDFQTGCPPETGWYLVELDQPGLRNDKPFDVDMCRIREDSEGRKKVDWAYWYAHNIRRWAVLPNASEQATPTENDHDS